MLKHSSVTIDRIMSLVEDNMCGLGNQGVCISCGADHDSCEPDARKYECYECGENAVYGAEELLMIFT